MEHVLKIRAHHLLCLQGYQGFGYNQEFEANMNELVELIAGKPELKFEVITGIDIICVHCPHRVNNECRRDNDLPDRIKETDLKVLTGLDLKEKTIENAQRLFSMVNRKFQTVSGLNGICGGCGWLDKCLWFQARRPE